MKSVPSEKRERAAVTGTMEPQVAAREAMACRLQCARAMRRVVFILVGLCASIAAAAPQSPGTGAPPHVLGGVTDTGDPQVVLLQGRSKSGPGEDCSAFVVSPHVLATAAHCVSPDVVGPDPTFTIFLGNDATKAVQRNDPSNTVAIVSAHFDPLFDAKNTSFGHDVGVVITATALALPPLRMQRVAPPSTLVGQPLRIVGYGQTNAADESSTGVRGQVTTTLDSIDVEHVVDADPAHTFCHGDSGGPELMMIDGVETVVGIVSARSRTIADPACGGVGHGTRMDAYADSFVQPFIAMSDPPAVDGGTSAFDGGGSDGNAGGCDMSGKRRGAPAATSLIVLCLISLALRRVLSG